jgi:hypothetical protein
LQQRPAPPRLSLTCGNFNAVLMSPERVSDDWVKWVADPLLMLPLGIQPRSTSKQELARYVMQRHSTQCAVIGIFSRAPERHVGLIEVTFDRKHLAATIELLINTRNHDFARVAKEVMPPLLTHLASRFTIEKFCALVPETHLTALAYYSAGDWSLEAELLDEVPSAALGRRLNIRQFAWFPSAAT